MKTIEQYLTNTIQDDKGCLVWQGALSSDGYPRVNADNGNGKLHRLVCQHYHTEDISPYVVRHVCDNPKCINPSHLTLGTNLDNVEDRERRGRTHNQVGKALYDTVMALRKNGLTLKEIAREVDMGYKQIDYIVYTKLPI